MTPIFIPATTLKTVIDGFSKVPWRRSSLAVLRYTHIRREAGAVAFTATDLDEYISYTFRPEHEAITPLARRLAAIRHAEDQCIFLAPLEDLREAARAADRTSQIEIANDRIRYAVSGATIDNPFPPLDVAEFPTAPEVIGKPQLLPPEARQGILDACLCASSDETRFILNGVLIVREKHPDTGADYPASEARHVIVATDGRHLFRMNGLNLPDLPQPVLVPVRQSYQWRPIAEQPWALTYQAGETRTVTPTKAALAEYAKAMAEYRRLSPDDPDLEEPRKPEPYEDTSTGRFRLDAGPWTILGNCIDGNYPNYRQVIPKEHKITATISQAEALRVAAVLPKLPEDSNDTNHGVTLDLSPEHGIQFKVGGGIVPARGGTATAPLQIRFNRFLVMKAFRFGLTNMQFIDEMSPGVFTAPGRSMVAMPIRVA